MKSAARGAAGLLALLLLLGVLSVPLAWFASGSLVEHGRKPLSEGKLLAPRPTADRAVRSMPIIDPQGLVATSFPDGVGLDDPARVQKVIKRLAERLGLGSVINDLLAQYEPETRNVEEAPLVEYPFRYGWADSILQETLEPAVIRGRTSDIVDLTSLLTIGEAKGPDEMHGASMTAYAILNRARDFIDSCDIQLNLAFLISLAEEPDEAAIDLEFRKAIASCPKDPAPLWWLGQSRLIRALKASATSKSHAELIASADVVFEQLRRNYPNSPLGWVGSADLRLDLADADERLIWRPFEARKWRREALAYYVGSRRRFDDPRLLGGHARALSAVGRHEEAVAVAKQLLRHHPEAMTFQVLNTSILQRAHRFDDAAQSIRAVPRATYPPGLALSPSISIRPDSALPLALVPNEPVPYRFGLTNSLALNLPDANSLIGGAARVDDLGFLPVSRWDYSEESLGGWCRRMMYAINLISSGQSLEAHPLAEDPAEEDRGCSLRTNSAISVDDLVAIESHDRDLDSMFKDETTYRQHALSEFFDLRQDLWRWLGDVSRAREVSTEWKQELEDDPLASQRLAETNLLKGRFDPAITFLRSAIAQYESLANDAPEGDFRDITSSSGLGFYEGDVDYLLATARLQLGFALEQSNRPTPARHEYTRLIESLSGEDSLDAETLRIHAHSQLGTLEMRTGNLRRAEAQLRRAIAAAKKSRRGEFSLRGAQENNLSLVYTKLDEPQKAITAARAALSRDPGNPVFVDTLAFAQTFGPRPSDAIETYRHAVREDPGQFPAWNNIAVLLAKDGKQKEAVDALRRALAIRPGYALAWKNLGIVLEDSTWLNFLSSQGAIARAGYYQRSLRGTAGELEYDTRIYDSGLDVSKPLAPDWTFATTGREPAKAFTWTMALLVVLRLAWMLGFDKLTGALTARVIRTKPRSSSWFRELWVKRPTAWAVVLATAVLAVPVIRSRPSMLELVVFTVGSATFVLLPIVVRHVLSGPADVRIKHFSWPPGMLVAIVMSPLVSFASPACLESDGRNARLRWAGPISVAVVAVGFLVVAAIFPVPVVRNLAMAAVTVLGSTLIPVKPFDGAVLNNKRVDLGITAALATTTIALALRWV